MLRCRYTGKPRLQLNLLTSVQGAQSPYPHARSACPHAKVHHNCPLKSTFPLFDEGGSVARLAEELFVSSPFCVFTSAVLPTELRVRRSGQ